MKRVLLPLGVLLFLLLPLHATAQENSRFPAITSANASGLILLQEFNISQDHFSNVQLEFNTPGDLLLVMLPYPDRIPSG